MEATTPTAPFTDVQRLTEFLKTKVYGPDLNQAFASAMALYGAGSMDELMALPARTNSGALSTLAAAWFALFPFVDMSNQSVQVDEVFVGNDGYTMMFWGRWTGVCRGSFVTPGGESIDLDGKTFAGVRYAYRLTFSPTTKKAILFEGLVDPAEWGRMMGSPELALASAKTSLYPA